MTVLLENFRLACHANPYARNSDRHREAARLAVQTAKAKVLVFGDRPFTIFSTYEGNFRISPI
jgi:hypothetical protein